MTTIRAYHRPTSLEAALDLLSRPGAMPLGGGTVINGLPEQMPAEVVDLQDLGLEQIARTGASLAVGATATLQDIVDSDDVPPLLRDLAYREAPNTLRNAATLGGTVAAADPESELLAGLLASNAIVAIAGPNGAIELPLAELLDDDAPLEHSIITGVLLKLGSSGASARAGRTPVDTPIVMVAGVAADGTTRLAATGVGIVPKLIDLTDIEALTPPGDFRGSPDYRRHLAATLGARVLARLGEEDSP